MEAHVRSAQDARDTRDVVTYLYGVVQHMQNTYDWSQRKQRGSIHPKLMKL